MDLSSYLCDFFVCFYYDSVVNTACYLQFLNSFKEQDFVKKKKMFRKNNRRRNCFRKVIASSDSVIVILLALSRQFSLAEMNKFTGFRSSSQAAKMIMKK